MEDGNSKTTLHHRRDGFSALGDYFPGVDVEITIDSTDATVYTMMDYFQRFLISAGYHEESFIDACYKITEEHETSPTRKEKREQIETFSKQTKKKETGATTDTAWEKLASTQKTSASTPEKTQSATSDKFPWEMFPIRLDIKKEKRVCWFECEDHMNKLILREQLTPKDYTISTNGVELVGLPKPKRRRKTK